MSRRKQSSHVMTSGPFEGQPFSKVAGTSKGLRYLEKVARDRPGTAEGAAVLQFLIRRDFEQEADWTRAKPKRGRNPRRLPRS